ncbi:MAG: M1 family metallopeptidase [Candidatus Marinimicrobia bacterium]|nr:M1 family metallopeptidase [Candidatus Neomarinimicrobiota bacterium]
MYRTLFIILVITTLLFGAQKRPFHSTPDREKDMIHMSLDVEVDIVEGTITGTVSHTFSPFSSSTKRVSFDTESTEIHRITLGNELLNFTLDGETLWIDLDKTYGWEDTITVSIEFTSRPTIGFYFIRPDSSYPDKQLQGWTQGEDTDNHFWVPLHDYPNDKMTWECKIKVDKPLTVISNGELVSVKETGDQRTFHWRENVPNVSYLLSIAVGEYKKVEDEWDGIPVNYWVYPEHDKEDAVRSFGRTPAMMEFFSEITGVRYPFEKYDQTIVEDFMWGGMENVTNTHQTDRTMHKEDVRPIHSSDGLVAHELAHQWFGDYLTTRNWPNVWLNEGFATYLDLLWTEHISGPDLAEFERLENLDATLMADNALRRPTVQPYFYNSIELFDANIYAKGSVILNMIRRYLGDDAFFRALKHYTQTHAAGNVETTDLKKAIEVITGKNLDWFFEQWVYKSGVPDINASYRYNRHSKIVSVTLKQTQDLEETSLFKLPITVVIDDGSVHRHKIFFDKKEDTFTFPVENKPRMVIVDEGSQIPKNLTFKKKTDELLYQLQHAPSPNDRIWAARELKETRSTNKIHSALVSMLTEEPKWYVRKAVVKTYQKLKPRKGETDLMAHYENQDERVQRSIVNALKEYETDEVSTFLMDVVENEKNDYIVSSALSSLIKIDLEKAKEKFDWAMEHKSHNETIRSAALTILTEEKTDENLDKLKEMAVYGNAPYALRQTIFRRIAAYREEHTDLIDYFADNIHDKGRRVRWVCADQIIRFGSADQFADVLEMADIDPLRGGKISDIYDALDERQEKAKKSKDRKEIKEVKKMQDMFVEFAEDWSNKK